MFFHIIFFYIRQIADELWKASKLEAGVFLVETITAEVAHPVEEVQKAAASALAALLDLDRTLVTPIMDTLLRLYDDKMNVSQISITEFIQQPCFKRFLICR